MRPIVNDLIEMYKGYGYRLSKMGVFEDYDWYYQNRDIMDDAKVLKVIQPNGKLLGIQADLTLTALKNFVNRRNPAVSVEKVFYYSNIYENQYEQDHLKILKHKVLGIEFFGNQDVLGDLEVLQLAKRTLDALQRPYILEVSDSQILDRLLDPLGLTKSRLDYLRKCISKRNFHEVQQILEDNKVSAMEISRIIAVSELRGNAKDVFAALEKLAIPSLSELTAGLTECFAYLGECELADTVIIDLSLTNKHLYYEGLIFQGFADGINYPILRGGRYRIALKQKNNLEVTSTGFTLDLDDVLPHQYFYEKADYLIIYNESDPALYRIIQNLEQRYNVLYLRKLDIMDNSKISNMANTVCWYDAASKTLKENEDA